MHKDELDLRKGVKHPSPILLKKRKKSHQKKIVIPIMIIVVVGVIFGSILLIFSRNTGGQKEGTTPGSQGSPPTAIHPTATPTIPVFNPLLDGSRYLSWLSSASCREGEKTYEQRVHEDPRDKDLILVKYVDFQSDTLKSYPGTNCSSSDMSDVIRLVQDVHHGNAMVAVTLVGSGDQLDHYLKSVSDHQLQMMIASAGSAHGLLIDVEQTGSFGMQNDFANFCKRIIRFAKQAQKVVGIALLPKVLDDDKLFDHTLFQDWKKLSTTGADFFTVVAADLYYTTPGSLTNSVWLTALVDFAYRNMRSVIGKIIWTLPNYGREWYSVCGMNMQVKVPYLAEVQRRKLVEGKNFAPDSNSADNDDPHVRWVTDVCTNYNIHFTTVQSFSFWIRAIKIALQKLKQKTKIIVATRWEGFGPPGLDLVPELKN